MRSRVAVAVDPHPRPDEEGPEHHEREGKGTDECRPRQDEDRPQDERQADAHEQHPLMQRRRGAELIKDHDKDEKIVNAESLLHHESSDELASHTGPLGHEKAEGECEGKADVEDRHESGLTHAHVVRPSTHQHEVQSNQNDECHSRPDPDRCRDLHVSDRPRAWRAVRA